jgi:hypothetical protein
MNFTVRELNGWFEIVSNTGRVVDWFQTEQDAEAKAEWLNQEYERVLSIL